MVNKNALHSLTIVFIFTIFSGCNTNHMSNNFDIQGHRGCRGLYPENTINGYIRALELGVNTLEMDVVVSKDNKVILSHEPFFNHEISSGPNNELINETNEKQHNLYHLTYDEIKTYDVGLKDHPRFPNQIKINEYKPTLAEMFEVIEKYKQKLGREIYYNIEIKRKPAQDKIYHPIVNQFVDLVMEVIIQSGCADRTSVQCFDHATLRILHDKYPDQKTVMLVEDTLSPAKHLDLLGFTPTIYSPYYQLVNPQLVSFCKEKEMRLIPWTVNDPESTLDLIHMGVDGIISDYPDMTIELWESVKTVN